jgi:uncharacterized membrane protein
VAIILIQLEVFAPQSRVGRHPDNIAGTPAALDYLYLVLALPPTHLIHVNAFGSFDLKINDKCRDLTMDANIERLPAFEATTSGWIHLVGVCIEIFGVLTIVAGIVWSTYLCLNWRKYAQPYDEYRIRIGRSLLLGLEVLVAADIVKTIAIELTFTGLGLLAGLVVVRTFLSWTLILEIEGRWPWQREALAGSAHTQNRAMP